MPSTRPIGKTRLTPTPASSRNSPNLVLTSSTYGARIATWAISMARQAARIAPDVVVATEPDARWMRCRRSASPLRPRIKLAEVQAKATTFGVMRLKLFAHTSTESSSKSASIPVKLTRPSACGCRVKCSDTFFGAKLQNSRSKAPSPG